MKDPSPGGKKRPKSARLQSLMGVRKLKIGVLPLKNCSFVIYEQIQLLKVSYERGDLEQFFKNFKDVRSYPYRGLISILEKDNDECTKLDACRGNFVHPPLKKKLVLARVKPC